MKIEFLPWYKVNNEMLRCDGEDGCGALVMSDDAEKHKVWHEKQGLAAPEKPEPMPETKRTQIGDLVCTDPACGISARHSHGRWTGEVSGKPPTYG